ncbi:hypothetical protein JCM10908_003575 [Rhodotorula pacifica]|uniref:FAD-dependent oxidoreductase n=1 Tax=Rhodotorula pacifica TaxID=1495444 RepID=UPI00317F08A8
MTLLQLCPPFLRRGNKKRKSDSKSANGLTASSAATAATASRPSTSTSASESVEPTYSPSSHDRLVVRKPVEEEMQGKMSSAGGKLVRLPKSEFFDIPSQVFPCAESLPAPGTLAFDGLASRNDLRVLIVGTGFAGLATAIACARQGFSVTICERSAGISPHGDSILFGANASRIFYRWGVGPDMYRKSGNRGRWWVFKDDQGTVVEEVPIGDMVERHGAPILQGRRSTFLGILGTEARMLGVNVRLASEVVKYWDSKDEPAVILRGGETLRADVIIAADGVHSPARWLLTPHARKAADKLPSGYSIHRSAITAERLKQDKRCSHLLDGTIRTWLGPDAHVCTYPLDNGNGLGFTYTHRDSGSFASLDWRDKKPIAGMLKELRKWDPVLLAALSHFPNSLEWTILDEKPEEEWISGGGRICFVGDSVHPMMPTAFQGGSQAIEDGAAIALCLALAGGRPEGVPLALETYEALRRPRVREAQALGKMQQDLWNQYLPSKSPRSRRPSRASVDLLATADHAGPRPSLRPLCFDLYDYDVEEYIIEHFETFARAIDLDFTLWAEWREDAARKANLPLDARRTSFADSIERMGLKIEGAG